MESVACRRSRWKESGVWRRAWGWVGGKAGEGVGGGRVKLSKKREQAYWLGGWPTHQSSKEEPRKNKEHAYSTDWVANQPTHPPTHPPTSPPTHQATQPASQPTSRAVCSTAAMSSGQRRRMWGTTSGSCFGVVVVDDVDVVLWVWWGEGGGGGGGRM